MCITIKGTTVSPKFVVPFAAPGVGRTGGGFYCAFFSSAISKPCRTTAAWIMSTFSFPGQLLHFIQRIKVLFNGVYARVHGIEPSFHVKLQAELDDRKKV